MVKFVQGWSSATLAKEGSKEGSSDLPLAKERL